jgi:hypothetical protein
MKYTNNITFDDSFNVNTKELEESLKINSEELKYVGNLVKIHEEYYLVYNGEELKTNDGNIYDLKDIGENKVHIIIGYEEVKPPEIIIGNPKLKISYLDNNGKPISGKESLITTEQVNIDIISMAEAHFQYGTTSIIPTTSRRPFCAGSSAGSWSPITAIFRNT